MNESLNEMTCDINAYLSMMFFWKGFIAGALLIIAIWIIIKLYKYFNINKVDNKRKRRRS